MRKTWIILLALLLSAASFAQLRTGNIVGKVVDPEGNPLPGVALTLTGSLISPLATLSSPEGAFRFVSLSPASDYSLKAEMQGFKTRTESGIIVTIGNATNLVLEMEPGVLEEQVTVVAKSPVVDPKKTTIGTNVTRDSLQSLPTSRDPWVVLQMAPSVMIDRENVAGVESGQQASAVGKGAASVFEGQGNNAWSMDGVVITDPASLGSPSYYDFDAFEEINVTVGGADVSSQTGGVNINMVTRRGGNKVTVGARFLDTDSKFQANNLDEDLEAEGFTSTNRVNTIKDYGFNLGFPIIRDKAWFWGSYGIQDIKTYLMTGAADDSLLVNYAAKLNLMLIPENRFEAFIHSGKKEKWGRNAGVTFPRGYHQTGKYHLGNPIAKIQDEHMFGTDFLISAQYSWSNAGFQLIPWADENLEQLRTQNVTTGVWERSFNYNIYDRPTTNASAKATYFRENLLGSSHEFILGFDYSDRNQIYTFGNGPGHAMLFTNYNTKTVDVTGDGKPDVAKDYGYDIRNVNVSRGADNQYNLKGYGVFFRDTISWGQFTAILGIRYDQQYPYYKAFTVPSVDPNHTVWKTYAGSGTAEALAAFLPSLPIPENNPDFSYTTWSPRLGLTWDVRGDGKNIVKLNLAKYGDYMGVSFATNFYPLGTGGNASFWWLDENKDTLIDYTELFWHYSSNYALYPVFNADGEFIGDLADGLKAGRYAGYDPADPLATRSPNITVGPDVNSSNTWEAIMSFEREVITDLGFGVDLTYRRYDNFNWTLPYYRDTDKVLSADDYVQVGTIPDEIGGFSTGEAAGKPYYLLKADIGATNFSYMGKQPNRYDSYYGLDLRANKRLSNNWMMNFSFTYQIQKAHYGEGGFLDPINFDPYTGNNIPNPTNCWALNEKVYSALVGGRSGKLNAYVFSPWMIKLSGLYEFPWDINASFTFTARDGNIVPNTVTITDYNAPNPINTSVTVYLEEFGKTTLPVQWNLNFRLQKMLRVGDTGRVYLMADLFNIFNNNTVLRRYNHQLGTYYAHDGKFVPNAQDNDIYEIVVPRVVRFGVRFDF